MKLAPEIRYEMICQMFTFSGNKKKTIPLVHGS